MKIIKVITLLFISFSLFLGNFANAAMFCCAMKSELVSELKSNKADIPCHKTAEKSDKKMQHDKSCTNCKNCVSASVITFKVVAHEVSFTNIQHNIPLISFSSVIPEIIYSPPKQIS